MSAMNLDETGNLQPLAARHHVISYMDWPALLGGALVAAALSALLTTFGVALGLTGVSAYSGKGMSAIALGIAAGLWSLWVGVSSVSAGAYLAGRMRHRSHDATEHESDIRDGAHGLVVWAISTLLAAYLATAFAGSVIKAATDAASGAAGGATLMAATSANPAGYVVDQLWRSNGTAPVPAQDNMTAMRRDAAQILATSAANGSVNAGDKAYLTQQVSAATGLNKEEAAKRVDDVFAQINAAIAKAKDAAESARRAAIIIAFLTAASLLVSAAAAWWAATLGGNHRDAGIDISNLESWS